MLASHCPFSAWALMCWLQRNVVASIVCVQGPFLCVSCPGCPGRAWVPCRELPGQGVGLDQEIPELILYLGLKQGFLLPPRPCPKDFSTVLAPAHSSFPPLSTAAGCQVLTVHLRTALQGAGAEGQQLFPPALSLLPLRLNQDRRRIPDACDSTTRLCYPL